MSRLGKQPITIPTGVTVTFDGGVLTVSGNKGTIKKELRKDVEVEIKGESIVLTPGKSNMAAALWGTYAAHIRNMIKGVTTGFEKVLEIEGVGYRAEVKNGKIVLNVGFSHQVLLDIPVGITATVEKTTITLAGFDKDAIGQFAADVRKVRKPEPYKGKGIRYRGEFIIRKQGKKAA